MKVFTCSLLLILCTSPLFANLRFHFGSDPQYRTTYHYRDYSGSTLSIHNYSPYSFTLFYDQLDPYSYYPNQTSLSATIAAGSPQAPKTTTLSHPIFILHRGPLHLTRIITDHDTAYTQYILKIKPHLRSPSESYRYYSTTNTPSGPFYFRIFIGPNNASIHVSSTPFHNSKSEEIEPLGLFFNTLFNVIEATQDKDDYKKHKKHRYYKRRHYRHYGW